MSIQNIYVKHNKAVFVCPSCDTAKFVNVEKFKGKKRQLNVKCSCQHTFRVELNFRSHYRRETKLTARFSKILKLKKVSKKVKFGTEGTCLIKNISVKGICISIPGRHQLAVTDNILLDFVLDDFKQSRIIKEAEVLKINNSQIGCKFKEKGSSIDFDKDLGFYLFP